MSAPGNNLTSVLPSAGEDDHNVEIDIVKQHYVLYFKLIPIVYC